MFVSCSPSGWLFLHICSAEYQGNLCAQCMPGYGLVRNFTCYKCLNGQVLIGLYIVAAVVMLCLMKLLCHLSLSDNQQALASGSELGAAEIIKFLVLYSQWLLLVGSMHGVPWPEMVAVPLQALGWVWALGSPDSISIGCLLQTAATAVPLPVARLLFYLGMPVAMLVVLLLVEGCIIAAYHYLSVKTRFSVVDRLAATFMVVAFFFLPTFMRIVFSFFSCVPIDTPVDAPYEAAAVGAFWVHDVNQLCYSGYHRAWSLGLGLPLLLIFCLGLPGSAAVFMLRNRSRLSEPSFLQHYGFLYRMYKPSCCYWEAVLMLQTITLVAVSVFGLTLGSFNQTIVINSCLTVTGVLLTAAKPHRKRQANVIALQGVGCLMLASYVAQSLLPYGDIKPAAVYGVVMGVVLILVNIAFVAPLIWKLLNYIQWKRMFNVVWNLLSKHSNCAGGAWLAPCCKTRWWSNRGKQPRPIASAESAIASPTTVHSQTTAAGIAPAPAAGLDASSSTSGGLQRSYAMKHVNKDVLQLQV